MTKGCFEELCYSIKEAVGEDSFKSEDYLITNRNKCVKAHTITCGGYICGEVKLAITLRMLSGASYLDIEKLFSITFNSAYRVLHTVLKDWICNDNWLEINFFKYLEDENAMKKVADQFAQGTSGGIISGCIGSIDGWLVKIKCPSASRDSVRNPGHYYSRKGFHALNVQVIVDKNKKFFGGV